MRSRLQLLAFFNAALPGLRPTGAAKSSLVLSLVAACIMLFAAPAVQAQSNTFPSSGNAGVGTTSPSTLLQVLGNSSTNIPLLSVEQPFNSSTYTSSWWPVASFSVSTTLTPSSGFGPAIYFNENDPTNNAPLAAIAAVQHGTTPNVGDLLFYPGYTSTSVPPAMALLYNGNVGIGTTSPNAPFHVYSGTSNVNLAQVQSDNTYGSPNQLQIMGKTNGNDGVFIGYNTSSNFASIQSWQSGASGDLALQSQGGSVGVGIYNPSYTLQVNGTVAGSGAYVNTSDLRLKKDVKPINYGLNSVMALRPISFNWKDQSKDWQKQHQIGLSAQNVEKVIPEVVVTANDDMKTKSIAYGSLVPVLVKAIQEQQHEIDQLKKTLAVYHHDLEQQTQTTVAALHRP